MTLMMRERINYEKGEKHGEIRGIIKTYKELDISDDVILEKVKVKFDLSEQEAEEYLQSVIEEISL